MRGHKRLRLLRVVCLLAFGLAACAPAPDIRERQEADRAELEVDADALFEALEVVADRRELPISRRDTAGRRLSTGWIDEAPSTRRRYFLSVFLHPAGIVVRANIVREASVDEDGVTIWRELPRSEEVTEEEQAIVGEAHEIWLNES